MVALAAVVAGSAARDDRNGELVGVWSLRHVEMIPDNGDMRIATGPVTGKQDRITFHSGGTGALLGVASRMLFRWELVASDRISISFGSVWNSFLVEKAPRQGFVIWGEPAGEERHGTMLSRAEW